MGGKWLELLKEISPRVTRVAVIRDPSVPAGSGLFAAIQTVAPLFGVELTSVGVRDASEIERGIAAFAGEPNGGLIVPVPSSVAFHRELLIALAARHQLPAIYSGRFFVASGGLISYAPDPIDPYRRAADYVDRILKGEKPAPSGAGADQVRSGHQRPDRQDARPYCATLAARPRRQGDRMRAITSGRHVSADPQLPAFHLCRVIDGRRQCRRVVMGAGDPCAFCSASRSYLNSDWALCQS